MAVEISSVDFWVVMHYVATNVSKESKAFIFRVEVNFNFKTWTSSMQMEAVCSVETLVAFYSIMRGHNHSRCNRLINLLVAIKVRIS
jgi:hypothetical protein